MSALSSTASEGLLMATVVLTVTFIVVHYIRNRRFYQLGSRLPGHKPWPIVGDILSLIGMDPSDMEDIRSKMSDIHGIKATWVGPRLYIALSNPEEAQIFCTNRDLFDRGDEMSLMKLLLGEGLLTTNGSTAKKARKIIVPSFQTHFLKNFIPVFMKHGDTLIRKLKSEVGRPAFDVHSYLKKCTFDIIWETTMEEDRNFQERGAEVIENLERMSDLALARIVKIWQQFDFIYNFTRDGRDANRLTDHTKTVFGKSVRSKMENFRRGCNEEERISFKRSTFVNQMLQDGQFGFEELRDHATTMLLAGHDTTALTISFVLVMLALNPDVQEKAYQEVNRIEESLERKETGLDELNKLEYLDMVIKETMRLYPAVPFTTRKVVTDIQMGKHVIPKGSSLILVVYNVHRNPDVYENPDKFDPDNFLPDRSAKRHAYAFIPFGGGARACVGSKHAMLSMKVLLFMLLRNFQFHCDYTMQDIKLRAGIELHMAGGFNVRVSERRVKI